VSRTVVVAIGAFVPGAFVICNFVPNGIEGLELVLDAYGTATSL